MHRQGHPVMWAVSLCVTAPVHAQPPGGAAEAVLEEVIVIDTRRHR